MSEQAITAETPTSDPLRATADAMSLALQAAKDGAADARQRVDEMLPAIGGFVSRLTYTTCYAVSYGVVFPSMLVARVVPKDNPIIHGLADGARAARDAIQSGGSTLAAEPASEHPHIIVPGEESAG